LRTIETMKNIRGLKIMYMEPGPKGRFQAKFSVPGSTDSFCRPLNSLRHTFLDTEPFAVTADQYDGSLLFFERWRSLRPRIKFSFPGCCENPPLWSVLAFPPLSVVWNGAFPHRLSRPGPLVPLFFFDFSAAKHFRCTTSGGDHPRCSLIQCPPKKPQYDK